MASYRMMIVFLLGLGCCNVAAALSLQGVTGFDRIVELNAATGGVIQEVAVRPGQRVARGDVLLRIDDTRQQARFRRAEAIAKSLQPDVTIARLELERAEELYALESLSQVDLQNAENKLARAQGEFDAADAEQELAAYDLNNAVVRAPFDGRILAVHVDVGQYVDPAVEHTALLTLADSGNLVVTARLAADQWRTSLINKSASIKIRNKAYSGRVGYIGYRQDPSGGYTIRVYFTAQQALPAGLPASIEIRE